ncbi:hypothetical protein CPB84DRAFT_81576 [Gymnopilus junonius]|uniref:Uncharacterized protein n=1 Tax=Gymnopilus junonius TaxID=109634 RepID=A0A9P5P3Q2_GYMJU|nr:hypothetical protein CPB84DRAFT_81576 [Gymnopilus junonius]
MTLVCLPSPVSSQEFKLHLFFQFGAHGALRTVHGTLFSARVPFSFLRRSACYLHTTIPLQERILGSESEACIPFVPTGKCALNAYRESRHDTGEYTCTGRFKVNTCPKKLRALSHVSITSRKARNGETTAKLLTLKPMMYSTEGLPKAT